MIRRSLLFALLALAIIPSGGPLVAAPPGHVPVAHAGDAMTAEGGVALSLDASHSWDADGDVLSYTWTQVDGPAAALDVSDPVHPSLVAPTPGVGGVPAENQVLVFHLVVSDGLSESLPSEIRIMVLKPFDLFADSPAVVTNSLVTAGGVYPPGSLGFAMTYAMAHPGTRVTFNIPASDPSYNAAGGYWQLPHSGAGSIPPLRNLPSLPSYSLFARGLTIDGFSQKTNAAAAGAFVNPVGPAIFIPGVIMDIGNWSDPAPYPSRIIVRGLAQEMHIEKGDDIVLSGNYHNVYPDGLSSIRGAFDHVGFSSGGTACMRLSIYGGAHIRIGGSTPEERNLIGRGCPGALLYSAYGVSDLQVVGNFAGVDVMGTNGIIGPNGGVGISVSATGNPLDVRIGGVTEGSRNVISGYDSEGLYVGLTSLGVHAVIQGNYFGTDAAGTFAIPSGFGAFVESTASGELLFGGPEPGAGNLLSGNAFGLFMSGGIYTPWTAAVQGNRVGTTADGMSTLPNTTGISLRIGRGALVGGAGPGEGNLVSGNTGTGIEIGGYAWYGSATLFGNRVGVAADGVTPLGNGGSGILSLSEGFCCPVVAPTVGGIGPGEGNVVAYNGGHGVLIDGANRYGAIRGNSIFGNAFLGISLGNYGPPRANDPGDGDADANFGMNYPELLSAASDGAATTVIGQIDTLPGSDVAMDFFANDTADPSGNGEGKRYLGTYTLTTPSVYAGPVSFAATLAAGAGAADVVTATATDSSNNTSEFSRYISTSFLDQLAPVFACPAPSSAIANAAGMAAIPDVLTGLSATDNVTLSASLTFAQSPAAGTLVGAGSHAITVSVTDAAGNSASCQSMFIVNPAPPFGGALSCSAAAPTVAEIWPPNHMKVVTIGVLGVTGASASDVSIRITAVLQDEPTNTLGDGSTPTDGGGIGASQAWVRAERTGTQKVPGNGRVYEIQFTASSPGQTSCTGAVMVGVPHDRGKGPAIDDLIRYDSTIASGPRVL